MSADLKPGDMTTYSMDVHGREGVRTITRTVRVLEPVNEHGMIRAEVTDDTAAQYGRLVWIRA